MAKAAPPPALEWIASAIGLILLAGIALVIGGEALGGGERQAPDLEVVTTRVVQTGTGFVLEFEARNNASATAAAVAIEGSLPSGEKSAAVIDYVPGNSTRRGGLFFTEEPRGVEVRALGYQDP